jgi:hypothetical protein
MDSLEQNLLAIQERKRELMKRVLTPKEKDDLSKLPTIDDLYKLFTS